MLQKTPATDAFWLAYRRHAGLDHDRYVVAAFGDSAALADELLALVLEGRKRATASLRRDYASRGEPLPQPGDLWVVLDGAGTPRCILRTTAVTIQPLAAVDASFAWDEGEGDRSRAWWLRAHRAYFARQAAREGFAFDDTIDTVFERFDLVWPPDAVGIGAIPPRR